MELKLEELTLDEAISRAREKQAKNRTVAVLFMNSEKCKDEAGTCAQRAYEYGQIAEWLQELKDRREAEN